MRSLPKTRENHTSSQGLRSSAAMISTAPAKLFSRVGTFLLWPVLLAVFSIQLNAQTFTFTNAGATGPAGPTQTQIDNEYASTNLNGKVKAVNGIQYWIVPNTGYYKITALGAQGGNVSTNCVATGGLGASMTGEFLLKAGDTLKILVGQQGITNNADAGGGGGTFITTMKDAPIIIAGGGGGASNNIGNCGTNLNGVNASITTSGTPGANGLGTGGVNGNGGVSTGGSGGGGGGLLTDGTGAVAGRNGYAFINGGAGATGGNNDHGGFGGGASGWFTGGQGGGGGGYSGGGTSSTQPYSGGGGGGSYNSGAKPVNVAGVRTGNGLVKIEVLSSGATNDAGVVSIDAPTVFCSGLNAVVVTIQNFGKNRIDSVTINWTVNGSAQTPVKHIGVIDTIGGSGSFIKQVNLGNYNFNSSAHTIKVWTSLPNGVADTVKTNDTSTAVKQVNLPAPTGVNTSALTPATSTIVWTPGSLSNKWAYLHSTVNTSPVGPGTVVTSPTASFTGLTERTTYYFYVREICPSGDSSVWQGPFIYRTPCANPLNGAYTINPSLPQSATNFHSIADAALACKECTITGPVVFNIAATTFNEQVEVGVIPGASTTNRVTFVGASKTTTILTFSATTNNSATLRLNGSQWVTFRDMTIRAAGASFGWGINLLSASNNNIRNCIVEVTGGATSTSTNFMGIVLNGNATTYSTGGTSANNYIDSNSVNAGYYTLYCFTNSGTTVNHYRWNTLTNGYAAGAYFNSAQTVKFLNNFISPRTTVNNDGLVLFNGNSTSPQFHEIKNNVIINAGNRGIYMATSTGSSGSLYGEMVNNMIGGGFRAATPYGIYTTSSRWKIYHNTVYLNSPGTGSSRAYMQTAAGNNNILKNNIFAVESGNANAIPVEISTATYVAELNYNNYYNGSAPTLARIVGVNFDASNFNGLYPNGAGLNSVNSQPQFVAANNLHLLSTYDAPSGDPTLGVTTDIDGDARCTGVFTMGADHTNYPQILPSAEFVASDSIFENSGTRIVNTTKGDPSKLAYLWMVDGIIEGTGRDFDFAFPATGSYEVSLIIVGCTSSDTVTKNVNVVSPTSVPMADFIADRQIVDLYAVVNLRDASKHGPTQWKWSATPGFDAFFTNDLDQNTSVFFGAPGFYDICLNVENALGVGKDTCKDSYIYVKEEYSMCGSGNNAVSNNRYGKLFDDGGPSANYGTNRNCTFLIDACASSLNLKFSVFNVGAGDALTIYDGSDATAPLLGSFTGTAIPGGLAGITANSGKMFIRWTTDAATQTAGFAAEWEATPDATPAPVADFGFADTLYTDEDILFTSSSAGSNLKYEWDVEYPFGQTGFNGGDKSTEEYSYNTAGTYDVKLRVHNCAGSNSIVKTITVIDPTTPPQIDFEADKTLVPVNGLVNFTNKTLKGAYSYRWEITPSLGVTIKPSVNDKDINASFMVPGSYAVKLVAKNAIGEDSLTKTAYITVYDYCNPGVAAVDGKIGISNVTFEDIDNTSSSGVTPYTSYTNLPQFAMLTTGGTYPISISRTNTTDLMNRKVWIDWNIDGDFDDAGEEVLYETAARTLTYTANITVPLTATEGFTRMRVGVSHNNGANKPCGWNPVGEFEDYTVQVIKDAVAPVVTLAGPSSVNVERWYQYVEPGFTAMDNIDGNLTSSVVITSTVDSTTEGVYKVTYEVTDQAGNTTTVERTVVVTPDVTLPVITLNGSSTIKHTVKTPFADPGATASDYFNRNFTAFVVITSTVDTNKVGNYTITYEVTDFSGNKAVVVRNVEIVDDVAPVINMAGSDTVYVEVKTTYTEPGVSATDNYDAAVNVVYGAVDVSKTGVVKITYTAKDSAGNTATRTRTVIVRDTQAPVIKIKGLDTVIVDVFTSYLEPGATATDNYCTGLVVNITSPTVNINRVGDYNVTYDVTDCEGNVAATVTRVVRVVDRVAPKIQLKGVSTTTRIERWKPYVDAGATYTDNYYSVAELTPLLVVTSNVNTSWEGIYEYCYDLTDPSGNVAARVCRQVEVVANTTGLGEELMNNAVNVYPNPTRGELSVAVDFGQTRPVTITIMNILGETIATVDNKGVAKNIFTFDLSGFAAGLYMVKIESEGMSTVQKVNLVN